MASTSFCSQFVGIASITNQFSSAFVFEPRILFDKTRSINRSNICLYPSTDGHPFTAVFPYWAYSPLGSCKGGGTLILPLSAIAMSQSWVSSRTRCPFFLTRSRSESPASVRRRISSFGRDGEKTPLRRFTNELTYEPQLSLKGATRRDELRNKSKRKDDVDVILHNTDRRP